MKHQKTPKSKKLPIDQGGEPGWKTSDYVISSSFNVDLILSTRLFYIFKVKLVEVTFPKARNLENTLFVLLEQ